VSAAIVLGDQADEGNGDAPVRRGESDRRLDGRQIVVKAATIESKELWKESESIASESLEGHWVIGRKAAKRRRDEQRDGGRNDGNESEDHRRYANMYSIEHRTGEESGGCTSLERGRMHKAEGSIGSKNGLVSLISE
jgi:hypothetical protein